MFDEFIAIEENNEYYVVYSKYDPDDHKHIKLMTRDGKHFISHKNKEFINFVISDLKRMGFPEIQNNGAIRDEDIPFCSYYIFNNQNC